MGKDDQSKQSALSPSAAVAGSVAGWVKTSQRRPTKNDADCEGCVWTWQEYHAEDDETGEWKSIGFSARRHHFKSVVRDGGRWIALWHPSDLKEPPPPNAGGKPLL